MKVFPLVVNFELRKKKLFDMEVWKDLMKKRKKVIENRVFFDMATSKSLSLQQRS